MGPAASKVLSVAGDLKELEKVSTEQLAEAVESKGPGYSQFSNEIRHWGIDGKELALNAILDPDQWFENFQKDCEEGTGGKRSLPTNASSFLRGQLRLVLYGDNDELNFSTSLGSNLSVSRGPGSCSTMKGIDFLKKDIFPLRHCAEYFQKDRAMAMIKRAVDNIQSGFPRTVTQSPRYLLSKLFKLQGIHLDPKNIDPAVREICVRLGYMDCVGEMDAHDMFINYRVYTDADLAEKLYFAVSKECGINAFIDKKCLVPGEDWMEGFIGGLKKSRTFVCLISTEGLKKAKNGEIDKSGDNLLLEYEIALMVSFTIGVMILTLFLLTEYFFFRSASNCYISMNRWPIITSCLCLWVAIL